ncbi:restriction endonuclease subunit S [Alteromonas sp. MmMcT2-2]|uniref:restriction endonuclease subunit S n=1 Tax=Alteromonas sp. MmMcT2-2 TaxID=2917732 RepID=UPI001EF346B4|nr:restriction endonuclease subunit S [Alteromonas sp. MmMcT2-2]MCG7643658.1 restriction endonuclease subunit S [Alteromonas sp. MmMcT2-2]|tara:strand:+ start:5973 stop:7226 length:1254 start_codon:yes stop_codon:yes gene_type:complete
MVPSGWNTLALSEITKEKISYGIVQAGPNVKDGIPYIKSADVGGEIDVDSLQRTAKEIHHKYRRSSVHPNDIVFSLRGNIARTSIVPTSLQEANLTQGTARISVNDKNDTKFVYYKLASTPILNRINALSKGSTFKEISLEELRKVKLALPPLEEQRKIAKILSTWDKAINTTERLIDNSKQQKKALMQQLLTGKKRLLDDSRKPFEGEWEEVKLGELIEEFVNGYAFTASNYKNHGIPIITMGNISLDGNFDERQLKQNFWEDDDALEKYKIKLGDLLIAMTDVTPDKNLIGRMTIVDVDKTFYLNQRVGLLKLSNKIDSIFLKYLSNESRWRKYSIAVSASGVQANMGTKDIKKGMIHLPHIAEQKKIASVLTNADKEIEILEQQLADFKQEKKALMQQLLTGKRRVKVDNEVVA